MNVVSYYRVSTARQGQSGLGLDAQRTAIESFCKSNNATTVAEFTEIETGKRNNRPQIAKAIQRCKETGATLVIGKLDRLARNVHFVSGLMESGVSFIAADNPNANRLTVHLLAAIAEHEAHLISKRTKEALAASRARGVLPRIPTSHEAASARAANSTAAAKHAEAVKPIAKAKRGLGWSLQQVADFLNGRGHRTRFGKAWSPTAVMRLLA
ncbi:MAG: resolvase [Pirellula sp.]|nr:resolvase [Pirellula sp.]